MPAAKTALITGARRGIGFEIATKLLGQGFAVVICDTDAEGVGKAVQSLDKSGQRVMGQCCDVRDEASVASLIQAVEVKFGGIDVLVNNAGISPKHNGKRAPVAQTDVSEWREVLDINLTGAFICSKLVLPHMKSARWGRIVNISSQAARTASMIAGAHYAASKAGMLAMARTLAAEVGPDGITVNCVAPGRIMTPMADEAGEQANAEYLKRIPVNRLGVPADVANVVAFLVSEEASFLTGTVIDINGGSLMI
ncbi:MAG: SDR family oxidoreductase [Burkholderiaceae bacterium]|nr:SDR family oxidoreductase [Burkholderiaceae bacterium]MCD8517040.1 SDR family oxidoreductase [Burkholderiaceae bacterium]MCD8536914.1 SDR family oxidoreductase [Burkholderiaceae bacterium]MCD8566060.1 SDR family oxidoreductase [Burkholderiaceae bacterium]